jgi:hypothetical protein
MVKYDKAFKDQYQISVDPDSALPSEARNLGHAELRPFALLRVTNPGYMESGRVAVMPVDHQACGTTKKTGK